MLTVLFGLAGSGKNYVGKVIAEHFDSFFWDADDALTAEMKACIKERKDFTKQMMVVYIEIVIEKIMALQKQHKNLIVAQALYSEINRKKIYDKFQHAIFVYVTADLPVIHQRLDNRKDWVDKDYAESFRHFFQEPTLPHKTLINNNGKAEVISQAHSILSEMKEVDAACNRIRFFKAVAAESPRYPLAACDTANNLIADYLSSTQCASSLW